MNKLFFLLGLMLGSLFFTAGKVLAQCSNLNFSMGNFNNWQCYTGTWTDSSVTINPSSPASGRHTIISTAQLPINYCDERCLAIKKVPDGFTSSAKLGNDSVGSEIDAIEYTLIVDSSNALLLIHYAWIEQGSCGDVQKMPRFTMVIKDSIGNALNTPCKFIDFTGGHDLDFLHCKDNISVRRWSSVAFSLDDVIGRTIKIYFENRDCADGNHFGYAYIVPECRPASIDLFYCAGQTTAHLCAPDGFIKYTWTRSTDPNWKWSGAGRNFQNITLTSPIDGEIFTCEISSAFGDLCPIILSTMLRKTTIDAEFSYGVIENGEVDFINHNNQNWYDTCSRTATFVDRSVVYNSKKSRIRWNIEGLNSVFPADSIITVTFPEPYMQPVTYKVNLLVYAENGCTDTSSRYITIYPSLYLDSVRVNSLHARFTPQQEVLCNYTNITFTNNSFADIQVFVNKDCRIDPDTNIYLNCEWNWGNGTYSYQRLANGTNPTIATKYVLPNTETKVVVTLKVRIEGFDFEAVYRDTLIILPRPTAAFTDDGHLFSSCSEPEDGSNSRKVRFVNQSQGNIKQLIWNFGDDNEISGNIDDTLITNPVHAYKNAAGKYDILLVAIDSNQCRDSLSEYDYVSILGVRGDFSYSDTIGCVPITITFSLPGVNELPLQYKPDSIVVNTGGLNDLTWVGSSSFFRSRYTHYVSPGNYLPVCYIYKTMNFNGKEEQCVLEVRGKDSICIVNIVPDFDIMDYYFPDSPVVFTNTSVWEPEGLSYDSIIWDFGNGDFSYDFDGKTTFNKTGKYIVSLKMKVKDCFREKRAIVTVIEKSDLPVLDIIDENSFIVVYPNPVLEGKLVIEDMECIIKEGEQIVIRDMAGKRVFVSLFSSLKEELDISLLASGMYVVQIGKIRKKFIKQ